MMRGTWAGRNTWLLPSAHTIPVVPACRPGQLRSSHTQCPVLFLPHLLSQRVYSPSLCVSSEPECLHETPMALNLFPRHSGSPPWGLQPPLGPCVTPPPHSHHHPPSLLSRSSHGCFKSPPAHCMWACQQTCSARGHLPCWSTQPSVTCPLVLVKVSLIPKAWLSCHSFPAASHLNLTNGSCSASCWHTG